MGILDRFSLRDRKALVTGGGSGIGQALAGALAEAGADVAIADIDSAGAAEPVLGLKRTHGELSHANLTARQRIRASPPKLFGAY